MRLHFRKSAEFRGAFWICTFMLEKSRYIFGSWNKEFAVFALHVSSWAEQTTGVSKTLESVFPNSGMLVDDNRHWCYTEGLHVPSFVEAAGKSTAFSAGLLHLENTYHPPESVLQGMQRWGVSVKVILGEQTAEWWGRQMKETSHGINGARRQ